jgi:hypothetical protein
MQHIEAYLRIVHLNPDFLGIRPSIAAKGRHIVMPVLFGVRLNFILDSNILFILFYFVIYIFLLFIGCCQRNMEGDRGTQTQGWFS